jgi:3-oxoacyl-[acyl-carrier protein] reductase
MIERLKGRCAIITGGTRGIGRAILEKFYEEGAGIAFTYAKRSDLALEITQKYPGILAFQCTGNDRDEISKIIHEVQEKFGHLDILVNNAGITANVYFPMMTSNDWDRVMQTNVTAVYNWCWEAIRPMLTHRSGVIINVASVSGLFGVPGQSAYGASKGAILAFTRTLAAETAQKQIRVNAIVPGFIETDMTAKIPRSFQKQYIDRIAMKRFGKPSEVAGAAVFLASDEATYITGQTFIIDGGLSTAF